MRGGHVDTVAELEQLIATWPRAFIVARLREWATASHVLGGAHASWARYLLERANHLEVSA